MLEHLKEPEYVNQTIVADNGLVVENVKMLNISLELKEKYTK